MYGGCFRSAAPHTNKLAVFSHMSMLRRASSVAAVAALLVFACETCGKQFASSKQLSNHARVHADRLSCLWDGCPFTYLPHCAITLKKHVEREHGTARPHAASAEPTESTPNSLIGDVHQLLGLDQPERYVFGASIGNVRQTRLVILHASVVSASIRPVSLLACAE